MYTIQRNNNNLNKKNNKTRKNYKINFQVSSSNQMITDYILIINNYL